MNEAYACENCVDHHKDFDDYDDLKTINTNINVKKICDFCREHSAKFYMWNYTGEMNYLSNKAEGQNRLVWRQRRIGTVSIFLYFFVVRNYMKNELQEETTVAVAIVMLLLWLLFWMAV